MSLMREKALKQFLSGASLFGKDGAFTPLLKEFIDEALDAEMEVHLDKEERTSGNKRNGKREKTVKSSVGTFTIQTPQDRKSSFEPQLIRKRQTILADSLEGKILALLGKGNSYRDIQQHIKEIYNSDVSLDVINEVTDRLIPLVKAWQNRPLDPVYPIVWLDAMYHKVRDQGVVQTKALYNILAINSEGHKEIIASSLHGKQGAKTWLSILSDLKNRGVKDMLIACTDNLSGFSEAIATAFPKTEVQTCVVHQVRNSLAYVASKERKEFAEDLKNIYNASTEGMAAIELDNLERKWGEKHPIIIKSWRANWTKLSRYFEYSAPIRRLIYTTNPVEGYHRMVRKVTKTKGAFSSEMALMKLVYLASMDISKKWKKPVKDWGEIAGELALRFDERMPLSLNLK